MLERTSRRESLSGPECGRALLTPDSWRVVGQALSLSPRQLQLVQQIFDGKTLDAIARELHLGLGTVKTYSQRIYQKLDVRDQRGLALVVFSAYLKSRPRP
jgi:DNA-binding NarL/FixJ family response regulator